MDDLTKLVDRFGADSAEPVQVGFSGATVVRLGRGGETFYYKAGAAVGAEAERLEWLAGTGFPCPRVVEQGRDGVVAWMLSTALAGRDASQPWPAADRPAVIAAAAEALQALHSLPTAPFSATYPPPADAADEVTVVTHGDFCLPNVLIDPETLRYTGLVDLGDLGQGDRFVDLALMWRSFTGTLNPQYGGRAGAEAFLTGYGAEYDGDRFAYYFALEDA